MPRKRETEEKTFEPIKKARREYQEDIPDKRAKPRKVTIKFDNKHFALTDEWIEAVRNTRYSKRNRLGYRPGIFYQDVIRKQMIRYSWVYLPKELKQANYLFVTIMFYGDKVMWQDVSGEHYAYVYWRWNEEMQTFVLQSYTDNATKLLALSTRAMTLLNTHLYFLKG